MRKVSKKIYINLNNIFIFFILILKKNIFLLLENFIFFNTINQESKV